MTLLTAATLEAPAQSIETSASAILARADDVGLIALNAAIDAAQRGAPGHGFALIAEAVRALAETAERRARAILEEAATLREADVSTRTEASTRIILNADAVALAAAQAGALAVSGTLEAMRAGSVAESAAAATFGDFARDAALDAERVKRAAYGVAALRFADAPTLV